jgi:hypothetical protein
MTKRLVLILALAAALAACSPAGGSSAPDDLSSDAAPSMEIVSPSP